MTDDQAEAQPDLPPDDLGDDPADDPADEAAPGPAAAPAAAPASDEESPVLGATVQTTLAVLLLLMSPFVTLIAGVSFQARSDASLADSLKFVVIGGAAPALASFLSGLAWRSMRRWWTVIPMYLLAAMLLLVELGAVRSWVPLACVVALGLIWWLPSWWSRSGH